MEDMQGRISGTTQLRRFSVVPVPAAGYLCCFAVLSSFHSVQCSRRLPMQMAIIAAFLCAKMARVWDLSSIFSKAARFFLCSISPSLHWSLLFSCCVLGLRLRLVYGGDIVTPFFVLIV